MAHHVRPTDEQETVLEAIAHGVEALTHGDAEPRLPPSRPRYRKIVLAYDGRPNSDPARQIATDLALLHGAEVLVASVFEPPTVNGAATMGYAWYPLYQHAYDDARYEAEKFADGAADDLVQLGVKATPRVLEGRPGRAIVDLARREDADLVVVGTTRRSALGRALLGSTASSILDRAPCSVLVARGPHRPERILAATDGSHVGYKAVSHALHRASTTSAELLVMHVIDYPEEFEDVPTDGFLQAVMKDFRMPKAPPRVRYVLEAGDPATRILAKAQEERCGLIALGSHGKGAVERAFLGSVSRRVAEEATASVLVVKDL